MLGKHLALVAVVVLNSSLLACSNIFDSNQSQAPVKTSSGDEALISDRPQNRDKFLAIVKLSQPALLSTVVHLPNGDKQIPDAAKAALELEQAEIIRQLQSISPEIRVIFRYKMVLNGLALVVPESVKHQIPNLPSVRSFESSTSFTRPIVQTSTLKTTENSDLSKNNSVSFIGADQVHRELFALTKEGEQTPVNGTGIHVGILDTGIDYTHSMMGGSGEAGLFEKIDPSQTSEFFPNEKVVGGIDLTGSAYHSGSEIFEETVPKPDANPIDESGHGTHVAGSVAGVGDGVMTYSGVAPQAKLHAIKVFGAGGSTSDIVVIAGLEYAADPNNDMDLADQLDVVNLSLGGNFGQPQILYQEAVKNLSESGTVVVASAGNSGAEDFIVGAPSTSKEAISVAAAIDDMAHNWRFGAIRFSSAKHPSLMVKAVEGPASKPIAESSNAEGKLVYIGLADTELSETAKQELKGNIAFIDRGGNPFVDKLKLAERSGAIGAIVANNQPGEAFPMGGEGTAQIPASMITLDLAQVIKEDLLVGPVIVNLTTGEMIEEPELIDTLTDFSSKGPRSQDALIKPEITGPGNNIISAMMGSGNKGVAMSGTSMSGPHVAGVMALLKQYRRDLNSHELKSMLMNSAKSIHEKDGKLYPVSRQGAGRVQTFKAATTPVVLSEVGLSLGIQQLNTKKLIRKVVGVKNISQETLNLTLDSSSHPNLNISGTPSLSLQPGEVKNINLDILLTVPDSDQPFHEIDGFVFLMSGAEEVARLPVLALATRLSKIEASDLKVFSSGPEDGGDAATELSLTNHSNHPGEAYLFNLIGVDDRKITGGEENSFRSRDCDLQAAGYRVLQKEIEGEKVRVLQIGVKLYNPMTTWHYCEVSVQFDVDGDDLADQELGGIFAGGGSGQPMLFASALLNANKMRALRKKFETDLAEGKPAEFNFGEAVVDVLPMKAYQGSTVAILEARLEALKLRPTGELAVKIATLNQDSDAIEADDFMQDHFQRWTEIDPSPKGAAFYGMPEVVRVAAGQQGLVKFTKGEGHEALLVLTPQNGFVKSKNRMDSQGMILQPKFEF